MIYDGRRTLKKNRNERKENTEKRALFFYADVSLTNISYDERRDTCNNDRNSTSRTKTYFFLRLSLYSMLNTHDLLTNNSENIKQHTIMNLKPLLLLSLAFIPPSHAVATKANNLQEALKQFMTEELAPHTPGFAVAIIVDGKPLITQGYGIRQIGSQDKINTETVFPLASVSKPFASAAAGILVQNKKLNWDNKVKTHLNDIRLKNPAYTDQLTLKHLLSHTTGLFPHAYTQLIEQGLSYERIVKDLHKVDFICKPGNCYSYQNIVYSLAGDIIHQTSKKEFAGFVSDEIFKPLAMQQASYGFTAFTENQNRVSPHIWRKQQWKSIKHKAHYYRLAPAAGVNASITDMEKWLMAQLGHAPKVLSAATLDTMHSKHIPTTARQAHYYNWKHLNGTHYGLGWRIFDYGEHKNFAHHGGWVKGIRTEMVFNRELQMGMVVLANSATSAMGRVVPTFLELYKQYKIDTKQSIAKQTTDTH